MIKDFRKKKNKKKYGQFSFFYILQLPHTLWFQILKNWPTLLYTIDK